jgi:flagellar hook-basal body complex protein FliE
MAIETIAAQVLRGGVPSVTSGGAGTRPDAASREGTGFGASLERLVEAVDSSHEQANAAVNGMLTRQVDVHDAMIALQRADLTLQFGVQVRNKLVNAYNEIMRMPV